MRLFEGAVGPTRLATASATARLDSQQRLAFNCHLEPAQARHTGHVKLSGSLPLLFTTPSPHTVLSSTFLMAPVSPAHGMSDPPPPRHPAPSISYLLPCLFPLLPHGGLPQPRVCLLHLINHTFLTTIPPALLLRLPDPSFSHSPRPFTPT